MEEVWKDIAGYEGLYQASNLGDIKSLFRYKITLTPSVRKGYYIVGLYKNKKHKTFNVHRLIASAFIDNEYNKSQINHKDGNKLNNNASNLEWCTPKENTIHSIKTGLKKTGHLSSRAKLTKNQIIQIRSEYKPFVLSLKKLSYKYNVSKKAILLIIKNKTYKNEYL